MQSFSQRFGDNYESAAIELGLANVAHLIPFSPEQIVPALESGDTHLNTLPIEIWDRAAGFVFTRTDDEEEIHQVPSGLSLLLKRNNVDAYSCSQGVSLLKRTAKLIYGKKE